MFSLVIIKSLYNYLNVKVADQSPAKTNSYSRSFETTSRYPLLTETLVDDTPPHIFSEFDELANIRPNLAGLLFSWNLEEIGRTPSAKPLFDRYLAYQNEIIEKGLDKSKIDYRVKIGQFWTDEIGLSAKARIIGVYHGNVNPETLEVAHSHQLNVGISSHSIERTGFTSRKISRPRRN